MSNLKQLLWEIQGKLDFTWSGPLKFTALFQFLHIKSFTDTDNNSSVKNIGLFLVCLVEMSILVYDFYLTYFIVVH